jgi:antitoxin ParD1/3/4
MSSPERRTFSLSAEQAQFIDTLVSSGTYASASEVVRAGVRALQERDAIIERWLRDQAVHTYDAMQADPARAIPAQQVVEAVHRHHTAHINKSTA